MDDFSKVIDADYNEENFERRAWTYIKLGKYEAALNDFKKARKLHRRPTIFCEVLC